MKNTSKKNGRKKIGAKLIIIMLALGLIPLGISNYLSYKQGYDALEERATHQLNSIRDVKKAQIESYFGERTGDIKVLIENPLTINGFSEFNRVFSEEGTKSLSYKQLENTLGKKLKNYVEAYGYYDLFLISKAGNVVYTAAKEKDFGINLLNTKYKDLPLSKIFNKGKSGISLQDFEYYEISGEPAAFIGGPIKGVDGVVVLQISIEQLNGIMQERSGLGETGETYIVGKDGLMRTDSLFSEESTILKKKIETDSVKAGAEGQTDIMSIKDYRGVDIFSSFAPLEIKGVNWIVLAEIDRNEILSATEQLKSKSIAMSGISAAIIILAALFLSKQITTPIEHLMEIMGKAKEGDLLVEAKVKADDELGDLANSFNKMIGNIRNLVKNSYEIIERMQESTLSITTAANEIGQASNEISGAVEEMASGSNIQAKEAGESFIQTNALAQKIDKIIEKSEDAIKNTKNMKEKSDLGIKTIAELKVSLSKNTESNHKVAAGIEDLTKKSKAIGNIVDTINSIAEQTNLLALNAAIEAARAGDSGKGFAVVAEEVRKLAEESRNATEQIKVTIDEIKVVIDETEDSMRLGSQITGEVDLSLLNTEESFNEINKSIDNTVDNIRILNEFANNIDEAKSNVLTSIENISSITEESSASTEEVSASIEEQTASIEEVAASMQDINDMVEKLDDSVKVFKV